MKIILLIVQFNMLMLSMLYPVVLGQQEEHTVEVLAQQFV